MGISVFFSGKNSRIFFFETQMIGQRLDVLFGSSAANVCDGNRF